MQHRLGRERGFIIRDSGVIGVPSVFEGAAHINDDADARASPGQPIHPAWYPATAPAPPPALAPPSATDRPGLRPQTFVSQSNPMPHKY